MTKLVNQWKELQ